MKSSQSAARPFLGSRYVTLNPLLRFFQRWCPLLLYSSRADFSLQRLGQEDLASPEGHHLRFDLLQLLERSQLASISASFENLSQGDLLHHHHRYVVSLVQESKKSLAIPPREASYRSRQLFAYITLLSRDR